jgi:hypothetical protein
MPISSLLCNQEDQTFVAMSPHDITKYKSTEGVVYFDTHLYNMISIYIYIDYIDVCIYIYRYHISYIYI